ncbi:MAG: alanine dehydrogenase [Gammaproteobacteria bacterium]|nr:alanine dehydrogenase [Gammaproteobacteria bacterium]
MIIGVPKEIRKGEYRVGMVPHSARELVRRGHQIIIESNAAKGIGFENKDYLFEGGVTIVDSAAEVFAKADLIVKVKAPQPSEYALLREDQILFTYLHLAPDPEQAQALLDSGCIAIAYETVTDCFGRLPLLTPMSEVAGRLSIQAGAYWLQKNNGGKGVLLGGVPGVSRANVVVIGGGVVGTNALRIALGNEANVTVLDKSLERLRELDQQFGSGLSTIFATQTSIEEQVCQADLVIGAVLVPGHATPQVVTRKLLKQMEPGSVVVDVSVDQGGCFETSRPTTFDDPTFVVNDIVHYCVSNMPGAVPRTAAFALNNATLPFIIEIASKGYKKALLEDTHLRHGLNVYKGKITHQAVAGDLNKEFHAPETLLN